MIIGKMNYNVPVNASKLNLVQDQYTYNSEFFS